MNSASSVNDILKEFLKSEGLDFFKENVGMLAGSPETYIGIHLQQKVLYDEFDANKVKVVHRFIKELLQKLENTKLVQFKNKEIEKLNEEIKRLKKYETYYNMQKELNNG